MHVYVVYSQNWLQYLSLWSLVKKMKKFWVLCLKCVKCFQDHFRSKFRCHIILGLKQRQLVRNQCPLLHYQRDKLHVQTATVRNGKIKVGPSLFHGKSTTRWKEASCCCWETLTNWILHNTGPSIDQTRDRVLNLQAQRHLRISAGTWDTATDTHTALPLTCFCTESWSKNYAAILHKS